MGLPQGSIEHIGFLSSLPIFMSLKLYTRYYKDVVMNPCSHSLKMTNTKKYLYRITLSSVLDFSDIYGTVICASIFQISC